MNRMFSQRCRARGLSLVEMLMGLAILVVVISLVFPAATRFRHQLLLRQATDRLLAGLNQARSEAVARGMPVVLCPAGGRSRSCGGSFRDGWLLFTDPDGDALFDPTAEELLARTPRLPAGFTVADRRGERLVEEPIRYLPDGTARRSLSLAYCAPSGAGLAPRTIVLNHVGRARHAVGEGRCPS